MNALRHLLHVEYYLRPEGAESSGVSSSSTECFSGAALSLEIEVSLAIDFTCPTTKKWVNAFLGLVGGTNMEVLSHALLAEIAVTPFLQTHTSAAAAVSRGTPDAAPQDRSSFVMGIPLVFEESWDEQFISLTCTSPGAISIPPPSKGKPEGPAVSTSTETASSCFLLQRTTVCPCQEWACDPLAPSTEKQVSVPASTPQKSCRVKGRYSFHFRLPLIERQEFTSATLVFVVHLVLPGSPTSKSSLHLPSLSAVSSNALSNMSVELSREAILESGGDSDQMRTLLPLSLPPVVGGGLFGVHPLAVLGSGSVPIHLHPVAIRCQAITSALINVQYGKRLTLNCLNVLPLPLRLLQVTLDWHSTTVASLTTSIHRPASRNELEREVVKPTREPTVADNQRMGMRYDEYDVIQHLSQALAVIPEARSEADRLPLLIPPGKTSAFLFTLQLRPEIVFYLKSNEKGGGFRAAPGTTSSLPSPEIIHRILSMSFSTRVNLHYEVHAPDMKTTSQVVQSYNVLWCYGKIGIADIKHE